MEKINLVQFLAYFSDWYPIIIPAAVLVLAGVALLLDRCRVWVIGYADDFENGPYKEYVAAFFRRVFNTSDNEDLVAALRVLKETYASTRSTDWRSDLGKYWVQVDQYYKYLYLSGHATEAQGAALQTVASKVSKKTLWDIRSDWELPRSTDTVRNFFAALCLLACILCAYKLLPEITIGCAIGYCVLRTARGTVRIGKKLKAHIADPNAHKETKENGKD